MNRGHDGSERWKDRKNRWADGIWNPSRTMYVLSYDRLKCRPRDPVLQKEWPWHNICMENLSFRRHREHYIVDDTHQETKDERDDWLYDSVTGLTGVSFLRRRCWMSSGRAGCGRGRACEAFRKSKKITSERKRQERSSHWLNWLSQMSRIKWQESAIVRRFNFNFSNFQIPRVCHEKDVNVFFGNLLLDAKQSLFLPSWSSDWCSWQHDTFH